MFAGWLKLSGSLFARRRRRFHLGQTGLISSFELSIDSPLVPANRRHTNEEGICNRGIFVTPRSHFQNPRFLRRQAVLFFERSCPEQVRQQLRNKSPRGPDLAVEHCQNRPPEKFRGELAGQESAAAKPEQLGYRFGVYTLAVQDNQNMATSTEICELCQRVARHLLDKGLVRDHY